ncbi:MAG TPA: penicillin-binding transpeptidase domain-containing protein, partial [Kineosporiaceae bacterium]|nr:penicillin-binding transpeptidase domain-containing protein [Kineosporiaceae bacterium]
DGGRRWTYDTTARLADAGGRWAIDWSPTLVHPALTGSASLTASRTQPTRGRILGARQEELAGPRDVVFIGIEPDRAGDAATTAAKVAALVDVDAGQLTRAVRAAKPTAFVDVITLRSQAYAPLAGELAAIPGVVTRKGTLPLGRTATFARALLGSVGPATKEIVDASDGRVRAGDLAGLSGLQRTYDAQLAGTPGLVVKAGKSVVLSAPATAGKDVTTTLDATVQSAAESALGSATRPAALVAIRPSTGNVVAVANGGPNAAGYDRALLGQYPPGSTFKVVSGYALLRQGYTAATPVPCPPSVTIEGQTIRNAENEVLGTVPFRTDFAESCNSAFVGSRTRVSPEQLADAAAALGYGEAGALGVQAFAGSVPTSAGAVEHGVDMIGQGKVLASPLTVATVSASVAAGARVTPRLVLDPAPSGSPAARTPLDKGTVTTLQGLMRAVVTEGTGTALAGVPGDPVHGKTGTAEFGTKNPPDTHAWFTGYQGDLAFAVIVENGGFGAKVAAPIAADFLRRLR